MKKIMTFIIICTLIAATSSAQQRTGDRFRKFRIEQGFRQGSINRPERMRLHRDEMRVRLEERRAGRDGRIGPMERRRIQQMKKRERRDMFRYRRNNRRRVI
jgi:hypothetical protein